MQTDRELKQKLMVEAALDFVPISVFFELSYRCNLRCVHCYVAESHREEKLSFGEIKSILDQLKELGCLFLYFSGGEPLIRDDFIEIFKYARGKDFVVSVYTNAILLTEEVIKTLKEFGIYEVHVSLYSISPEIHDRMTTNKGSFAKTMGNIERLLGNNITVIIKCPLTKLNFQGYEELWYWANKKGLGCVFTPYITAKNDGSKQTFELRLDGKLLEKAVSDPKIDPLAAQETEEENEFFVHTQDQTKSIPCFAGYNSLAINPLGDVFPCIQYLYKIGNLKEQSLKEIWQDSPQLKKVRSIRAEQLSDCLSCKIKQFCARCPGLALVEDGNMYGKSAFECKLSNIRSKLLVIKHRKGVRFREKEIQCSQSEN